MQAQDSLLEEVLEAKSQLVVVSCWHLLPLSYLRQEHQRHLQGTLFKGDNVTVSACPICLDITLYICYYNYYIIMHT